ncbi:MAG: AMP-binding protein [Actinobacteria bacterium]|nr:AMP-binding protein [Actinomycetota bacterium]
MDQHAVDRFQFTGQDINWMLRRWASTRPDHPFLIWEPRSGVDETWTYARFVDDVDRVAAGLCDRGVEAGDKVLIHADNCPEAVIAWYACARLGAVGVTTNTKSVAAEVAYFASHSRAVGVITQPRYAALIDEACPAMRFTVVTADNSGEPATPDQPEHGHTPFGELSGDPASLPEVEIDALTPAGILFTSGTTSRPKAVVHTHGNALWAARQGPVNVDMGPDDVYLIYLPFFHVNAQSWSIWTTLGVGGTVVLQPKFSASRFWEVIAKHSVTHLSLIPFVFKAVADQPIPDHPVRVGAFGLVMPVLEDWLKMRVTASWGMTETVTHATTTRPHEHYPDMSMGKPTPGYEFAIVDPDSGELVADGDIGELWVRGTRGIQLFLEYFDNPEANAAAFTEDGWLRTGDLVRMGEEGNFFYCDRDKDALKVGGENVSAREVEDAIRQVPGLDDVAVVAKTHDMLDMVPVAFVIRGAFAEGTDAELAARIIDHCAGNLSAFKVPRAVYFVDAFPEATIGKVAKNRLRELADAEPPVA